MKGSEFLKLVRKLGKERGVRVRLISRRGKGSHATLFFGERFTILKDRKKEIGEGLLGSLLSDLGLSRDDLRRGG